MTSSALSRRNVLRGLGGITVALPFLESLANPRKVARAGASGKLGYNGRPKRFVAWVNMHGTLPQYHRVAHDGSELVFPAAPDGKPSTQDVLAPIRQHLTVLEGVNMASLYKASGPDSFVAHASGACQALTGQPDIAVNHPWSPGGIRMPLRPGQAPDAQGNHSWAQCYPSIDQAIASRIDTSGVKHPSLRLGDNLDQLEPLFYGEGVDLGSAIWNPVTLFEKLFGGAGGEVDALRVQRRSVLDRVKRQMDRMRPRVSQRDRYVIDGHFDAIRDIEKGLEGLPSGCAGDAGLVADFAAVTSPADFAALGLGTRRYELFFKLLALALKCDLTRVAGVQLGGYTADLAALVPDFAALDASGGGFYPYHVPWSNAAGTEIHRHLLRWKNQLLVDFIEDLASADEGGHSVLDNTIVYHTSDMLACTDEVIPSHVWGYGNRAGDPSVYCQNGKADGDSPERARGLNMFYVGSGGGALKTGQLFDFLDKGKGYNPDRHAPEFGHYSHGEIMLTMARAMGIGPEQMPTFGMPEVCQGEASELLTGS